MMWTITNLREMIINVDILGIVCYIKILYTLGYRTGLLSHSSSIFCNLTIVASC